MQTFNANDSGETIRTKLNANAAEADTEDAANIKKDGSVAFTADQSLGGNKLTNVEDPTSDQDSATKAYVDDRETAITAAYSAAISAAITAAKSALHPVGSVYITIVATNPSTLLGFGTWSQIAQGRALFGQSGSDADFDTAEETGGSKTKNLQHTHTGTYTGTAAANPSADHSVTDDGSNDRDVSANGHTHTVSVSGTSDNGGSTTQDVLNPYFVVYVWKRTA